LSPTLPFLYLFFTRIQFGGGKGGEKLQTEATKVNQSEPENEIPSSKVALADKAASSPGNNVAAYGSDYSGKHLI